MVFFFFSSRRRHTIWNCDWSSDVCSSDLGWGCRTQDDSPVNKPPQRPKLSLAAPDFINQIGKEENRGKRDRKYDPNAEVRPLQREKRNRHDIPPLLVKQRS